MSMIFLLGPILEPCPADVTTNRDPGEPTALVLYQDPVATDNSDDIPTVTCDPPSGSDFPIGENRVTCTAWDGYGNSDSCSFDVNVNDLTCPAKKVTDTEPGKASVKVYWLDPVPYDYTNYLNNVACYPASGTEFAIGLSIVECNVLDKEGTERACHFEIEVEDNEDPVLASCPRNLTTNRDLAQPTALVVWQDPVATDNANDSPNVTCYPPSGTNFPIRHTRVTCTAWDEYGNSDSCTFYVDVNVPDCVEDRSEAGNTGLRVPWQPSVIPYLPIHVKTGGAAKITVEGSGFPAITAFIGIDNSATYKEVCTCGGQTASATLTCDTGGTINVLSALYGRRVTGSILCPHQAAGYTECHASEAADLEIVRGRCEGMTSCTVFAHSSVFGDPCQNIFKYLRVTYQCSGASGVVSSPSDAYGTGNDAKILLQNPMGSLLESVSLNVVRLSESAYTYLYIMIDLNGFHIGYEGQDPFISIQGDFEISKITSVVLESSKLCSCESDPSCTETVDADWKIGLCEYESCQYQLYKTEGLINDEQITASGVTSPNHSPQNARLYPQDTPENAQAWCAATNDGNQWIQVNLRVITRVYGVIIQGANGITEQWVTKFKVLYKDYGQEWAYVQRQNILEDMVFDGNTDKDTVVTRLFASPVRATMIKIQPIEWYGHICMRFDLIGCEDPDWQLVFKAVSGIATEPLNSANGFDEYDPYQVWKRPEPLNEDIAEARLLTSSFQGHYKSSFALNWGDENINKIKVVLLDDIGVELVTLLFDGTDSTSLDWFSKDRLLSSPYDDIHSEPQNYFSIEGADNIGRQWFINRKYESCAGDNGWMLIVYIFSPACYWEEEDPSKPLFSLQFETYLHNLGRCDWCRRSQPICYICPHA
ncbi:uncharacterized protein [Amphiura filiformis]|uniref:uncharacterized protein n=1 Tax=Amphiura filiformis TaxID=82378 RepID=UPI003B210D53